MSSKRWMSLAKGSTMGLSEVRMSCSIEIGVHNDVDSSVEVVVGGCWSLLFAFVWVPEVSKERALRPLLARCWAGDLESEHFTPWDLCLVVSSDSVPLRACGTCVVELDWVAVVVCSGAIPGFELWGVSIPPVIGGDTSPFVGPCWPSPSWVVTCSPGAGFCRIGLALMAMACANPCIIVQGYLLRSLLEMSASFGWSG